MLKQRILTAIVLIIVMLVVLFYLPPTAFCVVMGLIALGAAWEWTTLMGLQRISGRLLYLLMMACLFFNALFLFIPLVFCAAFIWWLFAMVLVMSYPRGSGWWGRGIVWRGLMGICVLLPCWVAINYIRNQQDGLSALVFLFVLIWGADSVAYFTGKRWGKNKLIPLVSPGKSVQGLFGALTFAIVITLSVLAFSPIPWQRWPWVIVLSLTTVLFSIVGDLFESVLKRQVGLKDSGQLLPGHGGLLDRIDSLTAAAPIFALGALLLSMYL